MNKNTMKANDICNNIKIALHRADVVTFSNKEDKIISVISRNPDAPLTDAEKKFITRMYGMNPSLIGWKVQFLCYDKEEEKSENDR